MRGASCAALRQALQRTSHGGTPVTRDTIYGLLQLCSRHKDPLGAAQIQGLMFLFGLESVSSLSDHLIRIFSACGRLPDALLTFSIASKPSVYTWSAIISAHVESGRGDEALLLFGDMQKSGVPPDKVTFLCVLRACAHAGDLEWAKAVHSQVLGSGLDSDAAISSALIAAYANCERIEDAEQVFESVQIADVVVWGAMIRGYATNDLGFAALDLFAKMLNKGIMPNEVVYSCILKACGSSGEIDWGKIIHHQVMESGVESNAFVGSSLIDMYVKGGFMPTEARRVFDLLPSRNVVSWGAMIGGYVQCGEGFPALLLLAEKMQHDGIKPDPWLLCDALKACEIAGSSKHCRVLHDVIVRVSVDSDARIGNTLVEVYSARCSLIEGYNAFHRLAKKDTDSWNALIGGYSVNGFPVDVFELFDEMQRQGFAADGVTYLYLLRACGESWERDKAREFHSRITRSGMESDGLIGSSLIDVYAKRNLLEEARHVFEGLACKDAVSWGVLLSAYAENGHCSSACELYDEMRGKGIGPDRASLLCILRACGSTVSLLERGREAHDEAIRCELESDLCIANTVIDMYAKCGRLDEARNVFEALGSRDEVSWAALIGGYGRHGRSDEVGKFIGAMKEHGLRPRKSIFTSLLAACSHTGDLEESLIYFNTMVEAGIEAAMEHHSCIADLLCRKGHLNEAKDVLRCMPMPPDDVVQVSLLTGCRTYARDVGGCISQISHVNDDDGDDDGDSDSDLGPCSNLGYTSCRSIGSAM